MRKKVITAVATLLLLAGVLFAYAANISDNSLVNINPDRELLRVAYVIEDSDSIPDPTLFTHYFYAFAGFNDNCDGLVIPKPEKLHRLVDLKKQNPALKIILSVGGDKCGGFSEMARNRNKRNRLIKSCLAVMDSMDIDGFDFDWEYPGIAKPNYTASSKDAANYVTLMKNLRSKLGKDKWLSFYSSNSANYMDFKGMVEYVDYVMVSGYELSNKPKVGTLGFMNNLYASKEYGEWSVDKSVARHISRGVPREKILLGIPFFAKGATPFPKVFSDYKIPRYLNQSTILEWDDSAKVPYYRNNDGDLILSFDNERSIGIKSDYIRKQGLSGGFVWHYDSDYPGHPLANALKKGLEK